MIMELVNARDRIHYLAFHDRFIQIVFVVVFVIFLSAYAIFGFVSGAVIFASFLFGLAVFHGLLNSNYDITGRISSLYRPRLQKQVAVTTEPKKCNVCGDSNCDREKVVHRQKPWAGLMVPIEVDIAFEQLLDKTFDEFVRVWYAKVSLDSCFTSELKHIIRYAASVVLSRLLRVDIGAFISNKLIPNLTRHVLLSIEGDTKKIPFHPALYSRKTELDYLRLRVDELLPLLMEERNLKSNIFSNLVKEVLAGWLLLPLASVADPSIINNLLLILLSSQSLTSYPNIESEKVEFLNRFLQNEMGMEANNWALRPDLCTILKDQSLLYAFMQFLKDQGAVNVLQFCLDVEEFNKRMLTPELTSNELDILHKDAWDLFSVYFSPHSPDNVGFSAELVVQMRKVLSKDVTKLRTSPPLFQAYEHAYSLLDKNYCPLFHTSDEFYTWLCGPRTPLSRNISGTSSPSLPGSPAKPGYKKPEGAVAKISTKLHKIKGALKPQTVLDGHAFDNDALQLEADTEFGEELALMAEEEERDLSSWRIRVNHSTESKMDPSGKLGPIYTITVQRIVGGGVLSEWHVERRLADFYALEGKLTEFHGGFPDTQLPPCGLLAPSPPTESSVYENYLQKLLANPALRGSDLLHWFLSSPEEFAVEDNAFGRLLRKSVPITLRKERGQNIEPFIATFFASTETKKKTDWKDGTGEVSARVIRCITNTSFKDNLGLSLYNFSKSHSSNLVTVPVMVGPSDSLILLGSKLFNVPNFVIRLAQAIHALLNEPIDTFIRFYFDRKIRSLLVPPRIAHLINLLKWVVFEKQTKSDPKEVTKEVSEKIKNLKGWSYTFYHSIFNLVQNPMLNKQLFYIVFDLVLDELFPQEKKKRT